MVASPVDEFETTCPNCRKDFDVLATDRQARCPHCHVLVQLTESVPAPVVAAPPPTPYVPPAPRAPAPAAVVDDEGRRNAEAERLARERAKAEAQAAAERAAAERAEAKARADAQRKAAAEQARADAKARAAAEARAQAAAKAAAKAAADEAKAARLAAAKAAKPQPAPKPVVAGGRPRGFARLNFLTRRERTAPDAREAVPILKLEGVGPTFAAKLEKAGIKTSDDLLESDPEELAKRTKIPKAEIRKWQDMADLVHVSGIGPQFAEVLVRCDINSVAELARQEARPLAERIQALLDSKKVTIVGTGVNEKRAQGWIAEARKLAPPPPSPGDAALKSAQAEDRAPQNPLLTETGLVEASAFRGKAFRVECPRCEEAFLVADNVRRGKCPYCGVNQALKPVAVATPEKVDPKELAEEARHEAQRGFLARFSRREVADVPAPPKQAKADTPRRSLFGSRADPEARARRDAERKAAADEKTKAKQLQETAKAEAQKAKQAEQARAAAEKDSARKLAAEAKAKADAERKAEAERAKADKAAAVLLKPGAAAAAAKPAKETKPAKAETSRGIQPKRGKPVSLDSADSVAGASDAGSAKRFTLFGGKALETVDCAHCGHKFSVKASQRKATCPKCHSRLALVADDEPMPLPARAAKAAPAPVIVPKVGDEKSLAKHDKAKVKAEAKQAKLAAKEAKKAEKLKAKQAKAQAKADAKAAKLAAQGEEAEAKPVRGKASKEQPIVLSQKASKEGKPADAKLQAKKGVQAAEDVGASEAKAAKLAAKEAKAKAKADAKAEKLKLKQAQDAAQARAKAAKKAQKLKAKEAKAQAKADAKAAKLAAKEAGKAKKAEATAAKGQEAAPVVLAAKAGKKGKEPVAEEAIAERPLSKAELKAQAKATKQAEADVATAQVAPVDDKKAAKLAAKEAKAKAKADAKAEKLKVKQAKNAEKAKAKEAKAKAKADAKAAKLAAKGKEAKPTKEQSVVLAEKAGKKGKPTAAPTNAEGDAYTAPAAGQAVPILALEGVGAKSAKKLEAAGIRTSDDLLAADPVGLAKRTGLSQTDVRKWQDMADLVHIDGVGPQFAEALVRSGVNSVAELARQQPKELSDRIAALQASKKVTIVGVTVGEKRTKAWIAAAKKHKPRAAARPATEAGPTDDKKAAKLAAKEAKAKAKADAKAAKLAAKEAKAKAKADAKNAKLIAKGKQPKPAETKADAKGEAKAQELSPRALAKLEKQRAKEEERRRREMAVRDAEKARLAGAENAGLWAQAVATPLDQQRPDGVWARSVEERKALAEEAPSQAERKEALQGKVRLVDGKSLFARLPEDKKERTPPRLPDGKSPFTRLEEDERKEGPGAPRLPDGRSAFERLPEDSAADYERLQVFGHKPGKAYTTKGGFHITEEVLATKTAPNLELGTAKDRRALRREAKQDDKTRREQERVARKEAKEARKQRLKEEREAAVARRSAKFDAAPAEGKEKPKLFGFAKLGKKGEAEEAEPAKVEVKKAKAAPLEAAKLRQVTAIEPAPKEGQKPRFGIFGRRTDVPEEPREEPAEAKVEAEPKRKLLKEKAAAARTEAEAKDDVAKLGFFERRKQAAGEKAKAKEAAAQAKADAKAQKEAEKQAKPKAQTKAEPKSKPAKDKDAKPGIPLLGFLKRDSADTPADDREAAKLALRQEKEAQKARAKAEAGAAKLAALEAKAKAKADAKARDAAKETKVTKGAKPAKARDDAAKPLVGIFSRKKAVEAKRETPEPKAKKGKAQAAPAEESKSPAKLDFAARRKAFMEAQAAKKAEREKVREEKARLRAIEDERKAKQRDAAAQEKAAAKAEADAAKERAKAEAAEAKRKAAEEKAAAKAKAQEDAARDEAKAEAARRKEEERARFSAERAAAAQERARRKEESRLAKEAAKGRPVASQPTPIEAPAVDDKELARARRAEEKARARELKLLAKRQKEADRLAARDEARSSRTGFERGDDEPVPAATVQPRTLPVEEPAWQPPAPSAGSNGRASPAAPVKPKLRKVAVQKVVTKTVRKPVAYDRAAIDAALRAHGRAPPGSL